MKKNMSVNREKLEYILWHFEMDTDALIWDVLADDPKNPTYSAVTATNRIKCYIELCQEIGKELTYSNVDGYLRALGLSDEERLLFEESRAKEAVYYIGEQY